MKLHAFSYFCSVADRNDQLFRFSINYQNKDDITEPLLYNVHSVQYMYTTYTCRKLSVRGCEMISDGGIEAVARHCTGLMQLNIQVQYIYCTI